MLPQWPRDRYLELAPKYWRATRARLADQAQLFELEMGWLKGPEPPLPTDSSRKLAERDADASPRRARRRDGALAEPCAVRARRWYSIVAVALDSDPRKDGVRASVTPIVAVALDSGPRKDGVRASVTHF